MYSQLGLALALLLGIAFAQQLKLFPPVCDFPF